MTHAFHLSQKLHEFPLLPEVQGVDMVELAEQARERLAGQAPVTQLVKSETLSHGHNQVSVKRADGLPGSCFKFLSALNSVAELVEAGQEDFAFATAGSYGIGVGHATKIYGGRATGFVPLGTNPKKLEVMRQLGVEVVEQGKNFDEALNASQAYATEKEIKYLHPFASLGNIAGTAILGLELMEQSPEMTHLVLPYGGGSLAPGVFSVIKQLKPSVHTSVVQIRNCSPFVDSLKSGKIVEAQDSIGRRGRSFFKSLGGVGVGKIDRFNLGVTSRVTDAAFTVTKNGVLATMYDYAQESEVLPEVAGGTGLEGSRQVARSKNIGASEIVTVLTGANADDYSPGYLESKSRGRQRDEAELEAKWAALVDA